MKSANAYCSRRLLPLLAGLVVIALLPSCSPAVNKRTAEPSGINITAKAIPSGEGYYISPFKADGSLATWVTNAKQTSDANVEKKGARLLSVLVTPWNIEEKKEQWWQEDAVTSLGGWSQIRSEAELSFDSLHDFRRHLLSFQEKAYFFKGWSAATTLYPEVGKCGYETSC